MQIRLTVLGPRSGRAARGCDVLITAPAGTALGAVSGALASAAGSGQPGGRSGGSSVVLYAGTERLAPTAVLGVPPLVDGALVSLHSPAEQYGEGAGPTDHGQYGRFGEYGRPPAGLPRLHVVGGPDAGGVHLLPGGQARIGRSADADVPLDDPDVSRLHCEVTVGTDGEVTVADLGSTNGTKLAGRAVGERPVVFPPGALLGIGESTLRLAAAHAPEPAPLPSVPDADGHLRVSLRDEDALPYEKAVPSSEAATFGRGFATPESGLTALAVPEDAADPEGRRRATGERARGGHGQGEAAGSGVAGAIGAWAKRRIRGGRPAAGPVPTAADDGEAEALRERWPDPATVLLTALGPGRRLWERGTGHPDALTVRLGTADLLSGDGARQLPDVPFTVDLRAPWSSALTLAGPRPRLAGLARAVLAQLCALHSPAALEIVLISADRSRGADQRAEEWSWLNWVPHLRPAHGQDCRLLLAFDRDQAESRTTELTRRLESGPLGPRWAAAPAPEVAAATAAYDGPFTVLVIDGDPGSVALRETVARLAASGPASGIHVLCLTETGERPVISTGLLARLSGDVSTTLHVTPAAGPAGRPGEAGPRNDPQAAAGTGPADGRGRTPARTGTDGPAAPGWEPPQTTPGISTGTPGSTAGQNPADSRERTPAAGAGGRTGTEGPAAAGWEPPPTTRGTGPGTPGSTAGQNPADSRERTPARTGTDDTAAAGWEPSQTTRATGPGTPGATAGAGDRAGGAGAAYGDRTGAGQGTALVSPPEGIVVDAVSAAWAEHFARALAPLREAEAQAGGTRSRHALPVTVRLLDELDLALATPARIGARWAEAPAACAAAGAVLGRGAGGRVVVDLVAEGPHVAIGGAPGAGKTELLRSFAAALAAGERPDRLALALVDGAGGERGEGLRPCADLPHVSTHLVAADPVRMREFAQALSSELKRRAEVLGEQDFAAWHAARLVTATLPHQGGTAGRKPATPDAARWPEGPVGDTAPRADIPRQSGGPGTAHEHGAEQGSGRPPALPRLVLVVDDFDALVAPALGSPGRPAAGSVVRALEAVARDGERLGVHLVFTTGRPERTAGTEADERARLRIALRMPDPESATLLVHVEDPAGLDDAVPGRGYLRRPGGAVTPFQAARVSTRIPRTATLRPTVVPLEWERMGDPPARRQVRELGNGPTDLALLASALERAAAESAAAAAESADSSEEGTFSAASRATPLI
ncbi:FtsK/SpoIIIE domain-containing protein [Streptomyces sp. NBC_01476]|uniref:FtsK/SpoIIIE domain-containing protein n=1 Tax=Streptomyces sp. NBC_01476 TaxID=2903881 RepID=UPI002E3348E1|nr:FtsK/SpoIIIE domain-containing protein [Streptomyces sp. NBC_01476]